MSGSITDVPGIEVGHAQHPSRQDRAARSSFARAGAVPGVDAQRRRPGTRETDCLRPENVVPCVHAVVPYRRQRLRPGQRRGDHALPRGAADRLQRRGHGGAHRGRSCHSTTLRSPVPPRARTPSWATAPAGKPAHPRHGRATSGQAAGAAIGRLAGNAHGMVKGGLGTASIRVGDLVVGAIVAVNCNGDVSDPATGEVLAGTLTGRPQPGGRCHAPDHWRASRATRKGFPPIRPSAWWPPTRSSPRPWPPGSR